MDTGSLFFQSQNIGRTMEPVYGSVVRVMPPEGPDTQRASLAKDDVVVCITGARTSAVAHINALPETAYVNQHVCMLRPLIHKVLGRFLSYCLWSTVGQQQLDLASYGLKQGLALDDIRSVVIPLPDKATQQAIIDHVDSKLIRSDSLQSSATRMNSLLRERRAALITAAVTGKIDVTRPVLTEAAA
jgi:type I restriction enzyme S subunit